MVAEVGKEMGDFLKVIRSRRYSWRVTAAFVYQGFLSIGEIGHPQSVEIAEGIDGYSFALRTVECNLRVVTVLSDRLDLNAAFCQQSDEDNVVFRC